MVYAPHWYVLLHAGRSKQLTCLPGRYDLNALFTKSFGDFTVNVQGLSRVCQDCLSVGSSG